MSDEKKKENKPEQKKVDSDEEPMDSPSPGDDQERCLLSPPSIGVPTDADARSSGDTSGISKLLNRISPFKKTPSSKSLKSPVDKAKKARFELKFLTRRSEPQIRTPDPELEQKRSRKVSEPAMAKNKNEQTSESPAMPSPCNEATIDEVKPDDIASKPGTSKETNGEEKLSDPGTSRETTEHGAKPKKGFFGFSSKETKTKEPKTKEPKTKGAKSKRQSTEVETNKDEPKTEETGTMEPKPESVPSEEAEVEPENQKSEATPKKKGRRLLSFLKSGKKKKSADDDVSLGFFHEGMLSSGSSAVQTENTSLDLKSGSSFSSDAAHSRQASTKRTREKMEDDSSTSDE